MEVIQEGKWTIEELSVLSCCWPPGSQNLQRPEPEDEF